jgi:sulfur carrier protein ThiS
MRVRVIPVAELKRQLLPQGGSDLWLDLPDGTTIGDVLRRLDVKVVDRLIVGLDGAYAPADTPLHDNAELTLVTPMEGGEDGERVLEPRPAR